MIQSNRLLNRREESLLVKRDKVKREVQNLLATDIIEPAEGPTPWTSPVVVVVPKQNGDVLFIDMRREN